MWTSHMHSSPSKGKCPVLTHGFSPEELLESSRWGDCVTGILKAVSRMFNRKDCSFNKKEGNYYQKPLKISGNCAWKILMDEYYRKKEKVKRYTNCRAQVIKPMLGGLWRWFVLDDNCRSFQEGFSFLFLHAKPTSAFSFFFFFFFSVGKLIRLVSSGHVWSSRQWESKDRKEGFVYVFTFFNQAQDTNDNLFSFSFGKRKKLSGRREWKRKR